MHTELETMLDKIRSRDACTTVSVSEKLIFIRALTYLSDEGVIEIMRTGATELANRTFDDMSNVSLEVLRACVHDVCKAFYESTERNNAKDHSN